MRRSSFSPRSSSLLGSRRSPISCAVMMENDDHHSPSSRRRRSSSICLAPTLGVFFGVISASFHLVSASITNICTVNGIPCQAADYDPFSPAESPRTVEVSRTNRSGEQEEIDEEHVSTSGAGSALLESSRPQRKVSFHHEDEVFHQHEDEVVEEDHDTSSSSVLQDEDHRGQEDDPPPTKAGDLDEEFVFEEEQSGFYDSESSHSDEELNSNLSEASENRRRSEHWECSDRFSEVLENPQIVPRNYSRHGQLCGKDVTLFKRRCSPDHP